MVVQRRSIRPLRSTQMRPLTDPRSKAKAILAVIAIAAAVSLSSPGAALAEVVRDFSFELKPRAHAAYTIVFSERSFDPTGAAVPPLTRYSLRFPLGMSIRRAVLVKRLLCDPEKLRRLKERKVCRHAQIGAGRAEVELLDSSNRRVLSAPIPSNLYLFLAKPTTKGAVATMLMLAVPDESAPIVRTIPNIRNTRVIGEAPFFDDPTADGAFGYRMELPPSIAGLRYNILRGRYSFPGLTLVKRARRCAGSRSRPRCRPKRSVTRRIFWLRRPQCPPSGKLTFQASYSYATLPSTTVNTEIACPTFAG
jgi:hypothetical protein